MSAASENRNRRAAGRLANKHLFRGMSPEPEPAASSLPSPDQPSNARVAPDLLQHVQSMRHLDLGLYQALRERLEVARMSNDPNALQHEIDQQKANLKVAGLDTPGLDGRFRNALYRLGLMGGPLVALPLSRKIILGLLLAVYALLSWGFVYSTGIFRHPAPEVWLIYAGSALGIAWIMRAPYSRKEGLALVAFAAIEGGLNVTYHAHSVLPVTSFLLAAGMVCSGPENRRITLAVFKNMATVGVYPRFGTDAPIQWVPFDSPWDRIAYQLTALVALVVGVWVPLLSWNWLWSLFIVPSLGSWLCRSLFATTKRVRSTEGRKRRGKRIVNGQEVYVELGLDDNAPSVVYANDPVPARPAEVKWVRVFNPGTGQYEWQQVFRGGNPNVQPPAEPVIPGDEHGSAREMTENEGDAIGVTRSDLPTPKIPL